MPEGTGWRRKDAPRESLSGRALRALTGAVIVVLVGIACSSSEPAFRWKPLPVGVAPYTPPQVGPTRGSILVAGGGDLGSEIWLRFLELAGGAEATIVVIPTAAGEDDFGDDWSGFEGLRAAGATNLTVLHTRNREKANSEEFVAPLREADGVWIPGGRQWRLVDAYLHTRVHQELFQLLRRGGVVGGTSAGASIQASILVRGDPTSNQIVFSPQYDEGFGLLSNAAVDQHLRARSREDDLWKVLDLHPDVLGIGLDEGTALVVQRDRAEVIGDGMALIYDFTLPVRRPRLLRPGSTFDLGKRILLPVVAEEEDGAAAAGATHF